MTRRRREKPSRTPVPDTGPASAAAFEPVSPADSRVERVALFVLLALIPLRAIASETHTFEMLRWLRNLESPAGASPATTLGFFTVILATALVVWCARLWLGGPRYQWTGTEAGATLLVVAAGVSLYVAGQKHLAVVGGLDFLGLVLYMLVLRQLLRRPWHIRLAMTVLLATGAMVATKCVYQRLIEMPLTIEYYKEYKPELTQVDPAAGDEAARAGVLHDYEQRLYARTVSGYFQHPNVLGSYLILIVTASLAVAWERFRRRPPWTLILPLALAAVGAVLFLWAQSKGAVLALGVAVILWAISAGIARRTPTPRTYRRLAIALWLTLALGAAGFIALLSVKPEALGRSMLFRHMYWQAAWRMLIDRGSLGVGADNFGRHFMRYKSVECPEDVDDPHSWVAKLGSEWGVIGLAGFLLMLAGFSRRLTQTAEEQPIAAGTADPSRNPVELEGAARREATPEPIGGSIILWSAAIGGAILAWWIWLCWGADPGYVVMTLCILVFPWAIGSLALAIESTSETRFQDDATGPLLASVCAGLIGFLLHGGIDLALFRPGAATTFFALMAVALALRGQSSPAASLRSRPIAIVVGAFGAVGVVLLIGLLVRPAAELGERLEYARRQKPPALWNDYLNSPGCRAYQVGADCYSLDGTALDELVEELTKRVSVAEQIDLITQLNEKLRRRDRDNSVYWHYLATLYSCRFTLGHDPADLGRSIAAMRQAVAAYPTSPKRHFNLADLLQQLAQATGSPEARRAAADELQTVLDLETRRIYVSQPNRMTEDQRSRIQEQIKRLRHSEGSAG